MRPEKTLPRFTAPGRLGAIRAAAFGVLLLGAAVAAEAQIVSVDAAVLHTPAVTEPVVEIYAAAAPFGLVRPYLIASWSLTEARPNLITQVAIPTFARGPVWNSLDAGITWFHFEDYRPQPSVSTYLGVRTPIPDVHLFGLASARPFEENSWSLLAGVAYTLLFRR
jgi:hypothetical protein